MDWWLTLLAPLNLESHYFQEHCLAFKLMTDCFLLFPGLLQSALIHSFFFFFSNSLLMRLQTAFPQSTARIRFPVSGADKVAELEPSCQFPIQEDHLG